MGTAERKAREKRIRSEQILASAYQVFQEVGYASATMDQIAERAELAKGTLYLYFKSKEEVYFSLLVNGLDILIGLLEESAASGALQENPLQDTARILYQFYAKYTPYFRIFMVMRQEDMQAKLDPGLSAEINGRATAILTFLSGQVQKALPDGGPPGSSPWQVANILWGAFTGITQLELTKEQLRARATRNEDLLRLCFELIGRGLTANAPDPKKSERKPATAGKKRKG